MVEVLVVGLLLILLHRARQQFGFFDPSRRYLIENKNARGKYLNVAGAAHHDGANLHVRGACSALVIHTLTHPTTHILRIFSCGAILDLPKPSGTSGTAEEAPSTSST